MGMWELVVVLIVGLIVLGPERLPVAIRTVARWIKTVKSFTNSVKAEVSEELRVHELHNNLKKAEQMGMQDLAPELKQSVQELRDAAESVKHSFKPTDNNNKN
ncbi:Sec-independent protein translocase subunit TatB [Pseudoalteromonas sp. McH1-7]|uniref:Sec-independent protein translocase protein TatB n=1 Tax=Pseudoalteromonas peptidolytica F12-50-A1 TaxID=1315280 RepID=A0A8I0MS80_9GAMM|nr:MULTISPECIES: Sec-independent protein translocase protein TatB [Pseudoalteromonas]MBE0344766.1 sec-independent protein translocase protein TatB [Pseudoalteromonas peptidolytica F12-50-A1]MDW7551187.1 Sec-independent protein translocase protein TatB [Pseudoalteromonas peptidolytica]NLR14491.1 Sec-independent protein translocase subunit TatB [Pseudoalteromonas peptidolytica]NUZ12350.1 Sec-independent protein translocase subunit TatB [Pseudoalteromonas sp. McH1-7]RRS10326.1 Sec-independent pro